MSHARHCGTLARSPGAAESMNEKRIVPPLPLSPGRIDSLKSIIFDDTDLFFVPGASARVPCFVSRARPAGPADGSGEMRWILRGIARNAGVLTLFWCPLCRPVELISARK